MSVQDHAGLTHFSYPQCSKYPGYHLLLRLADYAVPFWFYLGKKTRGAGLDIPWHVSVPGGSEASDDVA